MPDHPFRPFNHSVVRHWHLGHGVVMGALSRLGSQLLSLGAVSYTHLRAHETPEHLVCRLLLEKKKTIEQCMYNEQ